MDDDYAKNQVQLHPELEGSQQRGWEELADILAPDLDSLPNGTVLLRRGTQDGGIEFSCPAPEGEGVWAWQAKFLFDFKPQTFQQMKHSFEDALDNTPDPELVMRAEHANQEFSTKDPVCGVLWVKRPKPASK